eukprot:TRINITY_DN6818_c3_g1_i1.p1 TRINITY_DN6818_c3_g1~~TRINITY_DN6818_c3_g1_i1.p1  ORF type:complete len:537 (-),score=211.95 TRINITY_DN6818_c3_g1_i1:35-1486(-)
MDYVFELGLENAKNILPMLKWNEEHHIKFMRLSSEMFPFASHGEHGYDIASIKGLKEVLDEVGQYAREHGHRLTMHPGQFTQLGSPKTNVVDNAIKDLVYQARLLEMIGLGKDSVMILHMGGVYGDKASVYERFEKNWNEKVPQSVKDRLVLENDEMCYSVEDLLPICQKLKIPIVLDWHHDSINPSSHPPEYYLPAIDAIWKERGIKPKQHYSEGREGAVTPVERRGHSSRVKSLPSCSDDTDLMIEAKDKEMAVLELYQIYGLYPVDESIMYPDTNIQVKKRGKKAKEEGEEVEVEEMEVKMGSKPTSKKVIRKKVIVKEGEEHDVYGEDIAVVEKVKKEKKKRVSKPKEKKEASVSLPVQDSPSLPSQELLSASLPSQEVPASLPSQEEPNEEEIVDEMEEQLSLPIESVTPISNNGTKRSTRTKTPNYQEVGSESEEGSSSDEQNKKSFSARRKVARNSKTFAKKQAEMSPRKTPQQTD